MALTSNNPLHKKGNDLPVSDQTVANSGYVLFLSAIQVDGLRMKNGI
jgi:hypothetical protein